MAAERDFRDVFRVHQAQNLDTLVQELNALLGRVGVELQEVRRVAQAAQAATQGLDAEGRRIVNVAPGSAPTDAANVSQIIQIQGDAVGLSGSMPAQIGAGDTGTSGAGGQASRDDHEHPVNTTVAGTLTTVQAGDTADAGVATSLPRGDHQHPVETAAAGTIASVGSAAGAGTSTTLPRGDHVHPGVDLTTAQTITGAKTFDLDPAAPFIVTASSAVVTNLDADLLDGRHETAFALLAGRSGGQNLRGGTASGDDLTLESTSHATKGDVILQPTSGNVGVRTNAPQDTVQVLGNAGLSVTNTTDPTSTYTGARRVWITGDEAAVILNSTNAAGGRFALASTRAGGTYNLTLYDETANATRLVVSDVGNVSIGTASAPTGGGPALAFAQGSDPTGIGANTAGVYAKDVAGTAEVFVFDEAGNFLQISSHPNDVLNQLPVAATGPYLYPWVYRTTNAYLGLRLTVDMAGLLAWALSQGAPLSLVTVEPIPTEERRDWDSHQQWLQAQRAEEILAQEQRQTEATAAGEPFEEVPLDPYTPKAPPWWMQARGVVSQFAGEAP